VQLAKEIKMITKYAVYEATNGENTLYDTKEEAIEAFWVNVIALAKSNYHNTAYMVVEQNEDGSETWFNDNNKEIENPKTVAEKLKLLIKKPNIIGKTATVEII
jgi:hypothetical protein